ncbi:MAG: hypothetical protein CM1200mP10_20150 [Candidatus Neomarinimicrobiota bacterium]|nr:MAG: hypothetical protein CM1200mP10_20150 [Candidatus Neomarinimicrobiota bacterium]
MRFNFINTFFHSFRSKSKTISPSKGINISIPSTTEVAEFSGFYHPQMLDLLSLLMNKYLLYEFKIDFCLGLQ